MLRLFSSIRKTLILRPRSGQVNEGKTSRYVRYAVGEVLLIMVGIILALEFNNWNEDRRLAQERRELIENLKVDFGLTLNRLENALERAESIVSGYEVFLEAVGSETTEIGVTKVKQAVDDAFDSLTFQPVMGRFESAQSTGTIRLIQSANFINLIADFQRRFVAFQDLARINREQHFLHLRTDLRKKLGSTRGTIDFSDDFNPSRFLLSDEEFWEVVADKEVYGIFETFHQTRTAQRFILDLLKENTQQILTALEELD